MQISCSMMRPRLCTFDEASTLKFLAFSSLTSIFLNDLRNSLACACNSTIMYRLSNRINGENPPTPRSCTYFQSNSSFIDISTKRIVQPLLDRELTMGKSPWNWTSMDSNSALKRKHDDSRTIYV